MNPPIKIETFDGKTVKSIEFDGYEEMIIAFTDGTFMRIYERSQSGQIVWDESGASGLWSQQQEEEE
jgi:hypothetical protein